MLKLPRSLQILHGKAEIKSIVLKYQVEVAEFSKFKFLVNIHSPQKTPIQLFVHSTAITRKCFPIHLDDTIFSEKVIFCSNKMKITPKNNLYE